MRFHRGVQLVGCLLCLVGGFSHNPMAAAIGIVTVFFAVLLQANDLERRLDALEEETDESQTPTA